MKIKIRYWYIPEYCNFAIPVNITGVCDGFGVYNDLVDIDEPIGHYISTECLFSSLKDAKLAIRMSKDKNRRQEISNNHRERVFGYRKFRKYKDWFYNLRQWRQLRIDGIVGTWGDFKNELSLKDYKNKKVYRIK